MRYNAINWVFMPVESLGFLTFTPRNASGHAATPLVRVIASSDGMAYGYSNPLGDQGFVEQGASAVQSHPYGGEPWCWSKHTFAHRGHKEKVMKNDKLTNEQQAQSKSNRKKWVTFTWEAIKWGIRLLDLITRLVDRFEGGDE